MGWLFQILPFLIFVYVVVSVIRTAAKMAGKRDASQTRAPRAEAGYDPAESERTRRIQEEIRRKIAERRGNAVPSAPPVLNEPPVATANSTPRYESASQAPAATAAILERQQELADQMRALEAARLMQQRKAAEIASATDAAGHVAAANRADVAQLLADLRNPTSIRRAILLREILGSPVGLR